MLARFTTFCLGVLALLTAIDAHFHLLYPPPRDRVVSTINDKVFCGGSLLKRQFLVFLIHRSPKDGLPDVAATRTKFPLTQGVVTVTGLYSKWFGEKPTIFFVIVQ